MYVVFRDGSSQFRVAEGDRVEIDYRDGVAAGETIEFDEVLLCADDDNVTVGTPTVADAKVRARVLDLAKGPKIDVVRFRRRKNSRRKQGHRQKYLRVAVEEIVLPAAATE